MRTGVSSEEEQTPEKPRRKRKISEDDFVVDDEDEIEEMSESEEDVGFYARVSQMMDKRENRMTGMGETLSPRAAFWEFLKYNGIRMISRFAKFPENSKTLKRMLPAMEAGAKKIEQEMTARKNIATPSYWSKQSELVARLNKYPDYWRSRFRSQKDVCDGCGKNARVSATIAFRGCRYDSEALWKGDIRGWMISMGIPVVGKAEDESRSCSPLREGPSMTYGDTCLNNVQIYHTFQHWKHRILMKLHRWIVSRRLTESPEKLIQAVKEEQEGIVEQWFKEYKEDLDLSLNNCQRFSDPFGSDSPPKKTKRRNTTNKW
jgi:hypothetical protein